MVDKPALPQGEQDVFKIVFVVRWLLEQIGLGQVAFPATQNPSSDPNTLDDYEEGTFTPSVSFGGASVGVTYALRNGIFTKIGRMVHFTAEVQFSNKGSSTGNWLIDGLPFPAAATFLPACAIWTDQVNTNSGGVPQALLVAGASSVALYEFTTSTHGNSHMDQTWALNNSHVIVSGSYSV
jgi:hypothetical protein